MSPFSSVKWDFYVQPTLIICRFQILELNQPWMENTQRKVPEVSKKPNLNLLWQQLFTQHFPYVYSYLYDIYIVFSIISNLGMIYSIWKDVLLPRKCYTILYKGLDHLKILFFLLGGPRISPLWIPRDDCTCVIGFYELCIIEVPRRGSGPE